MMRVEIGILIIEVHEEKDISKAVEYSFFPFSVFIGLDPNIYGPEETVFLFNCNTM